MIRRLLDAADEAIAGGGPADAVAYECLCGAIMLTLVHLDAQAALALLDDLVDQARASVVEAAALKGWT
jgi:hypothetical protein